MTTNLQPLTATPADAPTEYIRRQYATDGFLLLSGLINDDIEALKQALLNEKAAPEVLPYAEQIVEDLRELVEHQVRVLRFVLFVPPVFSLLFARDRVLAENLIN